MSYIDIISELYKSDEIIEHLTPKINKYHVRFQIFHYISI